MLMRALNKDCICQNFNPLSANPTKWPNTLKQFVGKFPTKCLGVFGHFVKFVLKGWTAEVFLRSSSGCFLMFRYWILNDLIVWNTFLTFERREQCDNLTSEITWHKIRRNASILIYPLCEFKINSKM